MASGSCIRSPPHKDVCSPTVYSSQRSGANMFHKERSIPGDNMALHTSGDSIFSPEPNDHVKKKKKNMWKGIGEDPLISFKQCNATPSISWGPHRATDASDSQWWQPTRSRRRGAAVFVQEKPDEGNIFINSRIFKSSFGQRKEGVSNVTQKTIQYGVGGVLGVSGWLSSHLCCWSPFFFFFVPTVGLKCGHDESSWICD